MTILQFRLKTMNDTSRNVNKIKVISKDMKFLVKFFIRPEYTKRMEATE